MKKISSALLLIAVNGLILYACSKKNEEDLTTTPGGTDTTVTTPTCDTVNMRFAANIKPILDSNCIGCHGGGRAPGGVSLETYAGVKTVADNGRLIGAITHSAGYTPMPRNRPKLPDCTIEKIRAWVKRGAPDN